jgi:hypothetical protein
MVLMKSRHASAVKPSIGPAPFCVVSRTRTTPLLLAVSTHWPPFASL